MRVVPVRNLEMIEIAWPVRGQMGRARDLIHARVGLGFLARVPLM
jgi:hypothetical protein